MPGPNAKKTKLLEQVRHAIRIRHYSPRNEETYVHWIKRFIHFHNKRHPDGMMIQGLWNAVLASRGKSVGSALNSHIWAMSGYSSARPECSLRARHRTIGTTPNLRFQGTRQSASFSFASIVPARS